MKQILKILKKFTFPIIIVIILLTIQAQLDLSLPDYTANIINIGIQKRGISKAIPEVMEQDTMKLLLEISEYDDLILGSYDLKKKEDFKEKEQEKIINKYPKIANEACYFVKDLSTDDSNNLENFLVQDFLLTEMMIRNGHELAEKFNVELPKDTTFAMLFTNLPQERQKEYVKNYHEKISSYDVSMQLQIATEYVKKEYESIGVNLDDLQMNYIIHNGLKMLALAFSLMVVAICVGFLASRTATKFAYCLRNKVVSKVMSFSSKEFREFSLASLITRSTNDVQQIQMLFVMLLRILIYAPILGFGALFKVIGNSMNWVLALGIGVIFALIIFLFLFAMPKFKMIQKLVDRLNLVTRERLTGVPVIRAFGTAKHEEEKFDKANADLAKVTQFCERTMGIMMPTIMFVMNGVSILIIWVGSTQIDMGTLQVGTLMAFITYAMQVIMSFLMIAMVSIMIPRAWVSVKRIGEVLNTHNSITEETNLKEFGDTIGELEFKDVSFMYPDAKEEILKHISFKALKGTTTAFIGSTGSGKSTLINLIPRFFDVTKGSILMDNQDIRKVSLHDLREKIGYVPQKGNLFSGTLESNVLFGASDQSKENLEKACAVAQATEFIEKLPDTYQYEISQGGTNVSGGQRQRLSIARAIAKKPEFYIFDDSFSALDFKTDANLRKALREYTKDATIFIVAQRVSSIMNADQIIVLEQGQIVGKGTHQELMKNCQVYQEIASSQLKESELDA